MHVVLPAVSAQQEVLERLEVDDQVVVMEQIADGCRGDSKQLDQQVCTYPLSLSDRLELDDQIVVAETIVDEWCGGWIQPGGKVCTCP